MLRIPINWGFMSRTYKDQKKNKIKNQFIREPQLKARYSEIKIHGFKDDFDFEECPDCGGACEYERGYFTCNECGWGDFSGTANDDFTDEVSFMEAA